MASKKDYVVIAEAIRQCKKECTMYPQKYAPKTVLQTVEWEINRVFAKDNPLFNSSKFKEACHYEYQEPEAK